MRAVSLACWNERHAHGIICPHLVGIRRDIHQRLLAVGLLQYTVSTRVGVGFISYTGRPTRRAIAKAPLVVRHTVHSEITR